MRHRERNLWTLRPASGKKIIALGKPKGGLVHACVLVLLLAAGCGGERANLAFRGGAGWKSRG